MDVLAYSQPLYNQRLEVIIPYRPTMSQRTNVLPTGVNQTLYYPNQPTHFDTDGHGVSTLDSPDMNAPRDSSSPEHYASPGNSPSTLVGAVPDEPQPNEPEIHPPFPELLLNSREIPGLLTGHTQ